MIRQILTAVAVAMPVSATSFAQNPGPERLAAVEIRTERVADGLYVLFGFGGNIAVSLGDQGVLMVDSQMPELVPKIRAAIQEVGGDDINFAINTHWHYDHADGNMRLGPEGVWLVAHSESARRMAMDNVIDPMSRPPFDQPAYPPAARPVIVFDQGIQFHFNGERVDLRFYGPAHTAGDIAIFFRGRNAVHMGDVFTPTVYPFIDTDNGGDISGLVTFCRAVLAEIGEDTIVIPGHGPVSDYASLLRYADMLESARDRIAALITAGASLEQVIAARPTAEWDADYGDPVRFIDRAYVTLSR